MSSTSRLGLPFLSAGQAQKELFHNLALEKLDLLVAGAVEESPRMAPPATPVVGSCYIVGSTPTGEWVGQAGSVAGFTSAGWHFAPPRDGMTFYVRSTETWATCRDGAWEVGEIRGSRLVLDGQQVVGARGGSIASPASGTTVDAEARLAIGQILAAMRQHGLIEP